MFSLLKKARNLSLPLDIVLKLSGWILSVSKFTSYMMGGGPRVVVSTAAFQARVRGSVPGLGGLKETKNVSSPSTCESQYCGEPP